MARPIGNLYGLANLSTLLQSYHIIHRKIKTSLLHFLIVSFSQTSTTTVNTNSQPKNIITKTLSSVRLPQPNFGKLPKPNIPADVTTAASPIRNIAGK